VRPAIVTVLAAMSCTVLAQDAAELPSGQEVLERYIHTLGGREALGRVTSRVAVGTVESPTFGSFGRYGEFVGLPGRLLRAYQVANYGVVQQCFDGRVGWMETPEYGVEELTGERLAEVRRDAEFEDPLKLEGLYSRLTVAERTRLEESAVFRVVATCRDGAVETLFFAVESGLLVCRESPETARDGASRLVRTYYEDYRDAGGIQAARVVRYVSDDLIRIVRRNVTINAPIAETRFRKP